MTETTLRASARRPWLAGFAAFNAFAAWAGAIGLLAGGMDFGESINERLPFDSLVLAGLALGIIVASPLTVLAWSAWTGGPRTDDLALAVGLTLIVWIVVQVAVIRAFSLFQPATARRAADKAWLSDVYGWRGWLQEQVEKVQYGITDYLTEASPPTALRSAVVNAPGARFLLITAGNVDDEGHAASDIQAAASDRVTVWNVDGADHTGGYDTQPDDWQQRVIEFLDEGLR